MEITPETIQQAQKDIIIYEAYLEVMREDHPYNIPKTFKERFGYEIVLFEGGGFEFID